MTVDRVMMERLLLRVEMTAHRRGWDVEGRLCLLYDWHDQVTERAYRLLTEGDPIRCGAYAAKTAVLLPGNAAHRMFGLALVLSKTEDGAAGMLLDMFRRPGFLGAALVFEAWDREESQDEPEGDVRVADMPGSLEGRYVVAATVDGTDCWVRRIRGEKASVMTDYAHTCGGAIIESLRVFVAKVAGLPVPELTVVPTRWGDETA